MSSPVTSDYIALIKSFVIGEINASEFEAAFLRMFKAQKRPLTEKEFLILDALFADVDAFCSNPDLRDPEDLDEQQLLHRSKDALRKLNSLVDKQT